MRALTFFHNLTQQAFRLMYSDTFTRVENDQEKLKQLCNATAEPIQAQWEFNTSYCEVNAPDFGSYTLKDLFNVKGKPLSDELYQCIVEALKNCRGVDYTNRTSSQVFIILSLAIMGCGLLYLIFKGGRYLLKECRKSSSSQNQPNIFNELSPLRSATPAMEAVTLITETPRPQ